MAEADQYVEFEAAIERSLGEKIRADEEAAKQMWCALANVTWYHPEKHFEVGYSFRAAGGLVAEVRREGDYMDWYCCGPYPEVSQLIARSLKKEGWIYDDTPTICDEPGCLEYVCCGTPTPTGYRSTCSHHAPKR